MKNMLTTSNKGFTMIELMIAVSILAIIIAAMTVALQQQQRQSKFTTEAVDVDQTARATLDYIATEIRNAGSRQGKTFAVQFINGGSAGDTPCTVNTNNAGSANSPPDCLTIYTWDISRGRNGKDMPSVPGIVDVEASNPLQLRLPPQWFDENTGLLIGETEQNPVILLGMRSRTTLCNPDSTVNCNLQPDRCTECSVIVQANVDDTTKTATIDSLANVKVHNMPVSTFNGFSDFVNGVSVNGVKYGVLPTFSTQTSELTIVSSETLRLDLTDKELLMQRNGGQAMPIAGGPNAPGIVDLQLVFNLQNSDGSITKVGVPLAANNGMYPDFTATALNGRQQDIRSVEIYIVVKSKIKPQRMEGGQYTQSIPAIGDVLQRTVTVPSNTINEPEKGYTYRILSTTIYMRNHSREEFG